MTTSVDQLLADLLSSEDDEDDDVRLHPAQDAAQHDIQSGNCIASTAAGKACADEHSSLTNGHGTGSYTASHPAMQVRPAGNTAPDASGVSPSVYHPVAQHEHSTADWAGSTAGAPGWHAIADAEPNGARASAMPNAAETLSVSEAEQIARPMSIEQVYKPTDHSLPGSDRHLQGNSSHHLASSSGDGAGLIENTGKTAPHSFADAEATVADRRTAFAEGNVLTDANLTDAPRQNLPAHLQHAVHLFNDSNQARAAAVSHGRHVGDKDSTRDSAAGHSSRIAAAPGLEQGRGTDKYAVDGQQEAEARGFGCGAPIQGSSDWQCERRQHGAADDTARITAGAAGNHDTAEKAELTSCNDGGLGDATTVRSEGGADVAGEGGVSKSESDGGAEGVVKGEGAEECSTEDEVERREGEPGGQPEGEQKADPRLDAFQDALQRERMLTTGSGSPDCSLDGGAAYQGGTPGWSVEGAQDTLAATLLSRLDAARVTWPDAGIFDARGGVLGSHLALRVDAVGAFAETFASIRPSVLTCVAMYRSCVAVGTSCGITLVLLPRVGDQGVARASISRLGEARGPLHAVSCVAFNAASGGALLIGHASGEVALWEFRRSGWELVKALPDAHHGAAVTALAFLEGPQAVAVSGDSKGRLLLHPISSYTSITAMLAGRLSRGPQPVVLADGLATGPIVQLLALQLQKLGTTATPRGGAHANPDADLARAFFFQDVSPTAALDSLFVMSTLTGVYVCRVLTDSRMQYLTTVMPPQGIRQDTPPYTAWKVLRMDGPDTFLTLLAVCWEHHVVVLLLPINSPGGSHGGAGASPGSAHTDGAGDGHNRWRSFARQSSRSSQDGVGESLIPAVLQLAAWQLKYVGAGVLWMEEADAKGPGVPEPAPNGLTVAVASEQGPITHLQLFELIMPEGSGENLAMAPALGGCTAQIREHVMLEDALVAQQYLINRHGVPEVVHHCGLAMHGERLLLLSSGTLRVATCMTWQDRLANLRDCGLYELSLLIGLTMWLAVECGMQGQQLTDRFLWRVKLREVQSQAISAFLLTLLLHYLEAVLGLTATSAGNDFTATLLPGKVAESAAIASELCVLLQQSQFLFEGVFQRFQAAGAVGPFVEALEPLISRGLLPAPDPEVMQAFVEHYALQGRPEVVERAVLHMDIPSLDFNQVALMCRNHKLYSALIYIFNRGLNDYLAPACELLIEVAQGLYAEVKSQERPGQSQQHPVETLVNVVQGPSSSSPYTSQSVPADDPDVSNLTTYDGGQAQKAGQVSIEEQTSGLLDPGDDALGESNGDDVGANVVEGTPGDAPQVRASSPGFDKGGSFLEDVSQGSFSGGLSDADVLSDIDDGPEEVPVTGTLAFGALHRPPALPQSAPRSVNVGPSGGAAVNDSLTTMATDAATAAATDTSETVRVQNGQQSPGHGLGAGMTTSGAAEHHTSGDDDAVQPVSGQDGVQQDWSQRQDWRVAYGYKLLVYLHGCCQGQAYPPGQGALPEALQSLVKSQVVGWLLFADLAALQQLLPGIARLMTAPYAGLTDAPNVQHLLPGAAPVLHCLLQLDAAALCEVLGNALTDWDATSEDLMEALQLPRRGEPQHCSAAQAAVTALISVLSTAATLDCTTASVQLQKDAPAGSGVDWKPCVMEFVCRLLAEGRATVPPQSLQDIVQHVVEGDVPPGWTDTQQQEDVVLQILQHAVQSQGAGTVLSHLDVGRLLLLLHPHGMLRCCAYLHHLAGDYDAALGCYVRIARPVNQDRSKLHPLFAYLTDVLTDGRAATSQQLRSAVLRHIADIVHTDAAAAAHLVLTHFPDEHMAILEAMESEPELQHQYLKGLLLTPDVPAGTSSEDVFTPDQPPGGQAPPQQGAVSQGRLLRWPALVERYIALLCRFEPQGVLPFLQSQDAYRVEVVLPHCRRHGVLDAEAYLLERVGDIEGAVALHVSHLQRVLQLLQKEVMMQVAVIAKESAGGNARGVQAAELDVGSVMTSATGKTAALLATSKPVRSRFSDCHSALSTAVMLCQRHSMDAPTHVVHNMWFSILEVFVLKLRQLRRQYPSSTRLPASNTHGGDGTKALLRGPASHPCTPPGAPLSEEERAQVLQQLLTTLMEEVIRHMAGYVPLKVIGQRILAGYGGDQWGDFRGTLGGLLAAYHYEASILQTASRLISSDTYSILCNAYRQRVQCCAVEAAQQLSSGRPKSSGSGPSASGQPTYTEASASLQNEEAAPSSAPTAAVGESDWEQSAAAARLLSSSVGGVINSSFNNAGQLFVAAPKRLIGWVGSSFQDT